MAQYARIIGPTALAGITRFPALLRGLGRGAD
jgi:hypothetical protein